MEERLQKANSRSGFGSRRGCVELIAEGCGTINRPITNIGLKANRQKDKIMVNEKPV